jgi:hypothetical protein
LGSLKLSFSLKQIKKRKRKRKKEKKKKEKGLATWLAITSSKGI